MALCDRSFFHPAADYSKAVRNCNAASGGEIAIPTGDASYYISKTLGGTAPVSDLQMLVFIGTAPDRFRASTRLRCAFVSIRGTITKRDWEDNFRFHETTQPDELKVARVHTGFLAEWNVMAPQLRAYLDPLLQAGSLDAVVFTGHSAGGAVAQLGCGNYNVLLSSGAISGQDMNSVHVSTINYASPRVGGSTWRGFADKFVADNLRVAYRRDIVPMQAPEMVAYEHVGKELVLELDSNDGQTRQATMCAQNESSLQKGNTRSFMLVFQAVVPFVLAIAAICFLGMAMRRGTLSLQSGALGEIGRVRWETKVIRSKGSLFATIPYNWALWTQFIFWGAVASVMGFFSVRDFRAVKRYHSSY